MEMALCGTGGTNKKERVQPVKASPAAPLDPEDFTARFAAAARIAGFGVETFGLIHGLPLLGCTRPAAGRPRLYLSAGMHGDEPAPPWALLRLVESGWFDERADWTVCPLLNPTGFLRNTRENHAGLDLNRDYKDTRSAEIAAHVAWLRRRPGYAATFCLHEDYEAAGFYLYELNPENRPSLAAAVLDAVRPLGAIETAPVIDGRTADAAGIIRPISDPLLREQWPEAIYLRHCHPSLNYTFETASTALPLESRIAIHCAALRGAITALLTR